MLYIYKTDLLTRGEFIQDVEVEFLSLGYNLLRLERDEIVKHIILSIDGSIFENGVLQTKFGKASIQNCSTGCKAALLTYIYSKREKGHKVYISLEEAGDNVYDVLYKLSLKYDLYVCKNSIVWLDNFYGDVSINGIVMSPEEALEVMGGWE